jgi:hypothetical protein
LSHLAAGRRGPAEGEHRSTTNLVGELPMATAAPAASQPVYMDSVATEKITNRAIAVIDRIKLKLAGEGHESRAGRAEIP